MTHHARQHDDAPELLTIPQAAKRLGVGRSTVDREIADGRLPVVCIRGSRRVALRDLDDYIQRSRKYIEQIECPSANVVAIGTSVSRSADSGLSALLERERQKRKRSRSKRVSAPTTLPAGSA